jgi:hypothetical protein
LIEFARATTLATSSSRTDSCTISGEPALHVCPVAAKTPATTPLASASRSASGKTTWGDFDPQLEGDPVDLGAAALATETPVRWSR